MKRIHPDMAEVIHRMTRHGAVTAKEIARRMHDDFGLNVSHKYLLALTDLPDANDAERPFKAELFFPFMQAAGDWGPLHTLNRIARDEYDVPEDLEAARQNATKESAEAIAAINDPNRTYTDKCREIREAIVALEAKLEALERHGG